MPTPLILRCTSKLLRELPAGTAQANPDELPESGDSWCLNLLRIGGRKCLLATHQASLYSVFIPDVRRPDLKSLPGLFLPALRRALAYAGLPMPAEGDPRPVVITRADASLRSVLGCMKEIAFECQLYVESQGGLARCDPAAVGHFLNRTLHRMKGQSFATALDRLARLTNATLGGTRPGSGGG